MRILRLSHSGVVPAWRGRDDALRAQDHTVHLLTARAWDEGGRVVALGADTTDTTGVRTWGNHPALFVYDPRPLWAALGQPWDVLDVHEEPFALATAEFLLLRWLRRVPTPYVIYSAQNIAKRYPVPFRWFERAILRHAGGIYPCNRAAGMIMQRKGYPGSDTVVPLGFDPTVFRPEAGSTSRVPGSPVRVGYAGRLAEHKGVATLLTALVLHPELSLQICGSGPQDRQLRGLVDELGLAERVTFLGSLSGSALAGFYCGIDILAVPSLVTDSWVEQFCRVAVEAMACGTPVVATDSGALPEVVADAGIIVPAGASAPLGQALADLGADADRLSRLRAAAVDRAAAMTWTKVADAMISIYRQARHQPLAETPPVQVIVVAYHRADLLDRALRDLALPVIVVDNSSDPQVRAVAQSRGATYVDPGRNDGFAAGVNAGLASLTGAADILLLNPDATISSDAVRQLQRQLRAAPDVATIAAPQTDNCGRAARVMWPFPSPAESWRAALGAGRWSQPGFGVGSILLLRAEALAQVGRFDEDFFLYAEETDWAYRAHLMGWRHLEARGLSGLHEAAATSSDETRRLTHFAAGHERFSRKHFGRLGWTVTRAGVIVGAVARWAVRPGRGAVHRRRARQYLSGPLSTERAMRRGSPL